MTRTALALTALLFATAAHATTEDACVLDALAQLPNVAGLKIGKTTVEPRKVEKLKIVDVLISVEAAGRSVNYKFVCRDAGDEVSIVRRYILP
jgi:hypothetical protein